MCDTCVNQRNQLPTILAVIPQPSSPNLLPSNLTHSISSSNLTHLSTLLPGLQHTYLAVDDLDPVGQGFLSFLTFVILFSNLIPISLYVSMETIKFGQVCPLSPVVSCCCCDAAQR